MSVPATCCKVKLLLCCFVQSQENINVTPCWHFTSALFPATSAEMKSTKYIYPHTLPAPLYRVCADLLKMPLEHFRSEKPWKEIVECSQLATPALNKNTNNPILELAGRKGRETC